MAFLKSLEQVAVTLDFHTCSFLELADILLVSLGIVNTESLVGPPGGKNLDSEGMLGNLLVVSQVVNRIVGGADGLDIAASHQFLGAEVLGGKLRVALFVDFAGSRRIEDLVDAEDV